jgi:hypothetical protein
MINKIDTAALGPISMLTRKNLDADLVAIIAEALRAPIERDNDLYWAAEYGRPAPLESLVVLAQTALDAYRNATADDGK